MTTLKSYIFAALLLSSGISGSPAQQRPETNTAASTNNASYLDWVPNLTRESPS